MVRRPKLTPEQYEESVRRMRQDTEEWRRYTTERDEIPPDQTFRERRPVQRSIGRRRSGSF